METIEFDHHQSIPHDVGRAVQTLVTSNTRTCFVDESGAGFTLSNLSEPDFLTPELSELRHPNRVVDLTDNGARRWHLGRDFDGITLHDYSQNKSFTYNHPLVDWDPDGLSVTGEEGSETVYVVGKESVFWMQIDGYDVEWSEEITLPRGGEISTFVAHPLGELYVITEEGDAFQITPDSDVEDIGIVNQGISYCDAVISERQTVYFAGSDGRLYRYDDTYHNWTPVGVTTDAIRGVTQLSDETMLVLTNDGDIICKAKSSRWKDVGGPESVSAFDGEDGIVYCATDESIEVFTHPDTEEDVENRLSRLSESDESNESARVCSSCSFSTTEEYRFCPYDGEKLHVEFLCPACDFTTTNPDYRYCPRDGNRLR